MAHRHIPRFFRAALVTLCALSALVGGSVLANPAPAGAGGGSPVPPFTKDFFGISTGAEIINLPDVDFAFQMNLMKKMGVHWIRVGLPWALVQPQSGDPAADDWTFVDRLYNFAGALGMQVDAIVDNPPPWAEASIPPISCDVQPPFDLTAYAAFAASVAQRYPASVMSAIELENAPNLTGLWRPPDACAYTELMRQSYAAIKAANPNVTVLTGGFGAQNAIRHGSQGIAGDVFIAELYAAGAKGTFDVMSWHPYSYPCTPSLSCPKNRPWYRTDAVRQTMVDYGDGDKPIWATEFGSPTNGKDGDGHVDEATQSSIMLDAMHLWVQKTYTGPFFVFTLRDHGTNPNLKGDWFGLVSRNYRKKQAYYDYRYEATGIGTPPAAEATTARKAT
jgi:hypothetical protein